jgi:hypothetical protein
MLKSRQIIELALNDAVREDASFSLLHLIHHDQVSISIISLLKSCIILLDASVSDQPRPQGQDGLHCRPMHTDRILACIGSSGAGA